jgi:NAD(P)-dependent dehydrogenase (short-subunit alcohol dehydrogenase family)
MTTTERGDITTSEVEMRETTILVTGATDGLGRAVACELAAAGASVLIHGRDADRILATEREIAKLAGADRVRSYRADFSSLAEVVRMAEELCARERRLDVLVNNAGIGTTVPGHGERMLSADGHELRFAVNYLAGYALTRQLLPLLKASAPARIVNVSSAGQAAIDFNDVMLESAYSGTRAYCQSKLAQIMFTVDLAEELAATGVTATCLHPATYMPTKIVATPASSLEEGVSATVRLATDPEVEGVTGKYFSGTRESEAHPQAYDPSVRRRLAEISTDLVAPHRRQVRNRVAPSPQPRDPDQKETHASPAGPGRGPGPRPTLTPQDPQR